jgi:hypothetical protein
MLREEILYKTSKTGTTVFYFVPNITLDMVPFLEDSSYVEFNGLGTPIASHVYFTGGTEVWKLENVNGYYENVLVSPIPPLSLIISGTTGTTYVPQVNPNAINYVTGYSKTETFNKVFGAAEKATIQQRFNDNVTSTITAQTQVPVNYPTYVFFKEHEVDDMFANVKLSRSYETLDTLEIYNKPINTIPVQEAKTGIIFGKLEAVQTLKDEEGNNIRIPLKGVPIGIFNPTEEFPAPMSLDDNGDRFFMNLQESALLGNGYFDTIAYDEDTKFLRSGSEFTSPPDKFKFVTITNDNGEFVIYNSPIGNQVVVFEADLFKQGLTKDEIVLNNFPFPVDDDSNIGEFPCYYYNQIPVDVVPAWGTSQTGYTELNVSVNLDLRKWATYIFAPAAFGNEKLETTVAKNITSTFKIQIRDMTNKKFATKILETTQIPNDLDRRPGSKYFWFNEILDQRQQLEFFKFGCHVLKLPANLYDPNGYRTDSNGVPTNQRGLWLAAYQFNAFVDKNRCVRHTGGYAEFNSNGSVKGFWSHFNVNFFPGATVADTAPFAGLGKFPYEKPWSISYPEPYKIPAKPVNQRYALGVNRTYQSPYIVEEPAYSDGDLVGNIVYTSMFPLGLAGGFGIQQTNGAWFPNQISYVATKDYMYKYERGVSWNEKYANGYEPYWNASTGVGPYGSRPLLVGASSVVNGEKYQRVECGYGYFMKYHDWPRVFRTDWAADIYFYPDQSSSPGVSSPGTYFGGFETLQYWRHLNYNLDDQNLAFAFNQFVGNKKSEEGIDIYRIVESGLDDIIVPENFLIPTSAFLFYGGNADRLYRLNVFNTGTADALLKNSFVNPTTVVVENTSGGSITISNGATFTLNPGGLFYVNDSIGTGSERLEHEVNFTGMIFPGNDSFNSSTNKYESCNYRLEIGIGNGNIDGGGNISTAGNVTLYFNVGASISPQTWYINSSNTGTQDDTTPDRQGISSFGLRPQYHSIYSLYIESSPR